MQWKIRLPICIQAVLNCFKAASEDELVNAADALYEMKQEKPEIVKMRDSIRDLKAEIDELTDKFQRLNRDRSRSKSRTRSATRKSEYHFSKFCYYHQKFGASSSKCKQPCMWTTEN